MNPPVGRNSWILQDGELREETDISKEETADDMKKSTLRQTMAHGEWVEIQKLGETDFDPFEGFVGYAPNSQSPYTGWVILKHDEMHFELVWLTEGKRNGTGGCFMGSYAKKTYNEYRPFTEGSSLDTDFEHKLVRVTEWKNGFEVPSVALNFDFDEVDSIQSEAINTKHLIISGDDSQAEALPLDEKPYSGWVKNASSEDGWKTLGYYRNGLRCGFWGTWNEFGYLLIEGHYMEGKKDGFWKKFGYDEGSKELSPVSYGNYRNGLKEGFWTERSENIRESGRYRLGRREGKWTRSMQMFNWTDEYHHDKPDDKAYDDVRDYDEPDYEPYDDEPDYDDDEPDYDYDEPDDDDDSLYYENW